MDFRNPKMKNQTEPIMILGLVELDRGMTKDQIQILVSMLSATKEYAPVQFFENNTAAYGYISSDYMEQYDDDLEFLANIVVPILNDASLETADGIYSLPDGARFQMLYL